MIVHAKTTLAHDSAGLIKVHPSNWNEPHVGNSYTFTQALQLFGPCFSPEVGPTNSPGRYVFIGPSADTCVKKYFYRRNPPIIAAMFEVCWIPVSTANQVLLGAFPSIVGGVPTAVETLAIVTGQDVSTPVLSQVDVTDVLLSLPTEALSVPNLIGFMVVDQGTAWKLFEVRLQITFQVTQ